MFYIVFFQFIVDCFKIYNKISCFLFKLFFYSYYYRVLDGDVISWHYIENEYTLPTNTKEKFITYESDNNQRIFNRLIINPWIFNTYTIPLYTDFVFLNVHLLINNRNYTLYLRTNSYNFYICSNVIDASFIIYYLKYILKDKNCLCDVNIHTKYKLTILDNKFKEIVLNETSIITLFKTHYLINDNNTNKLK
jgi:hypothetical protein